MAESFPEPEGVLVRGVVEGSPADQVRLRAKDSIVAVDGSAVSGAAELMARVRALPPGSVVTLAVKRRGRDLELRTVVGTRADKTKPLRMVRGWLGVDAIELPAHRIAITSSGPTSSKPKMEPNPDPSRIAARIRLPPTGER